MVHCAHSVIVHTTHRIDSCSALHQHNDLPQTANATFTKTTQIVSLPAHTPRTVCQICRAAASPHSPLCMTATQPSPLQKLRGWRLVSELPDQSCHKSGLQQIKLLCTTPMASLHIPCMICNLVDNAFKRVPAAVAEIPVGALRGLGAAWNRWCACMFQSAGVAHLRTVDGECMRTCHPLPKLHLAVAQAKVLSFCQESLTRQ